MSSPFYFRVSCIAAAALINLSIGLPAFAKQHHDHQHGHEHKHEHKQEAKQEHKHEHSEGAKDVAAFHATLSPLWHAPEGKERISNACAKATTLGKLAKDIKSTDSAELQKTVSQFKKTCKSKPDEAGAAFSTLHDAFHKLAEHKH